MKYFSAILFLFLLQRCIKEPISTSDAFLKNTTSHYMTLRGYYQGGTNNAERLELGPGEEIKYGDGFARGKNVEGFDPFYFVNADSIVVTFDNKYPVTHYIYAKPPVVQPQKSYLYSSLRNLGNYKSYEVEKDGSSYFLYTYKFTEQDFQFAQ